MSLENVELPVLHSEKDIPEDVLSTFETYCIKDGISYAMNETKDEICTQSIQVYPITI